MTTTRYRHRTPEVEAIQWTGQNADALRAFAGPDFDEIGLDDRVEDPDETAAVRESKHGTWRGLKPGDWVVRLDEGLYEFSAADFAEQYEPVPAVSAAVPPTTQTALRDRIAAAIWERQNPGRSYAECDYRWKADAEADADAVLGVLPAGSEDTTTTRTDVLRQAAVQILAADLGPRPGHTEDYSRGWSDATHRAESYLRMLADQAQPDTPTVGDVKQMLTRMRANASTHDLDYLLRLIARWVASSEGRDALVDELVAGGYRLPHACGNCEGIDPDSCLTNPDRPAASAAVQTDEEA